MKRCKFVDDDCHECPQTAWSWTDKKGYCYYHGKLEAGLLEQARRYLSDTEVDSMFGGRARNDGRRLDHYTRS